MTNDQERHMDDVFEFIYRFVPRQGSEVFHRMAVDKLFELLDDEYTAGTDGSYRASEMRDQILKENN